MQCTVCGAQIVIDRNSGRSKGFGFVTMSDCQSASYAITDLNGTSFLGQKIVVKLASSSGYNNARPSGSGYGKGGGDRRY